MNEEDKKKELKKLIHTFIFNNIEDDVIKLPMFPLNWFNDFINEWFQFKIMFKNSLNFCVRIKLNNPKFNPDYELQFSGSLLEGEYELMFVNKESDDIGY